MSIGGSESSATLSDAIDYCYNNGVVLVACMMNENNDVTYYPAGYDKTIAVGSTDPNDTRSNPFFWSNTSGSNFGNHIDLVAPGNYMYGLSNSSDTYYGGYWGGTSQASPLVAGVVSLLLSQNPTLTFEEIRVILRESAEDQVGDPSEDVSGFDPYYGYGRLNAKNALSHPVLSIDNFELGISLYPNPADNILFIKGNKNSVNVSIYNILGKEVLSIMNTNNIDVKAFPKGVYIIKISDGVGQTNRKFIKN